MSRGSMLQPPPPFYDLLAASVDQATGEIDDEDVSVTKPGYVGQMKGIKQYLWDRGLYFSFKQNDLCKNNKCIREDVLHGKYVLPEVGVLFVYFQRHRAALPLANIFIVLAEIILFEGEIEPPVPRDIA